MKGQPGEGRDCGARGVSPEGTRPRHVRPGGGGGDYNKRLHVAQWQRAFQWGGRLVPSLRKGLSVTDGLCSPAALQITKAAAGFPSPRAVSVVSDGDHSCGARPLLGVWKVCPSAVSGARSPGRLRAGAAGRQLDTCSQRSVLPSATSPGRPCDAARPGVLEAAFPRESTAS